MANSMVSAPGACSASKTASSQVQSSIAGFTFSQSDGMPAAEELTGGGSAACAGNTTPKTHNQTPHHAVSRHAVSLRPGHSRPTDFLGGGAADRHPLLSHGLRPGRVRARVGILTTRRDEYGDGWCSDGPPRRNLHRGLHDHRSGHRDDDPRDDRRRHRDDGGADHHRQPRAPRTELSLQCAGRPQWQPAIL